MIRDFTDSSKQKLLSLVEETENEKWCDFTDWVGDRWYDFEEWIGWLNLKEDLSNVNEYHKKVIDKNNTTAAQIENIFSNVYSVETRYKTELAGIAASCRSFNQILSGLTDIIIPKNNRFTADNINALVNSEKFREYKNLFNIYVEWTIRLDNLLKDLRSRKEITDADKDEYIQLYEIYNMELKLKLDKLYGKLSEDEIRQIKFLIYTAEEPYRTIYLNQLDSYKIGNTAGDDTGYFTSGNNTINVDMPGEPGNPRGPFTTFFHESGHAIDYNYQNDGNYYSVTFRNREGQSLQDVIYADVRNNLQSVIAQYTSNTTAQQHIMDYIMGARSVDYSTLTAQEQAIFRNVQNYYRNDMWGAVNEACSDVYGGVTNNIIIGGYGHRPDYSEGETDEDFRYWYNSKGNATYNQSIELWAEFYSYKATGNQDALDSLREHFPEAYKFLEEMAASMV